MKVKVKYFQGHLYIVIFGIYQAAIPIFNILIGFGVIAEGLNKYDGIFRVFGVDPPAPTNKIQNSILIEFGCS